jgi:hypothetical protein
MASGDKRFINSMEIHARIVSGEGHAGTKAMNAMVPLELES